MSTNTVAEKKKTNHKFANGLSKKVGKAMAEYAMLDENDRILVAVSGGKDSFTLLEILKQRQAFVPIPHSLVAVHIDMGYKCIHPKIVEQYFQDKGYEYHIEKIDILKETPREEITCFWCSWNRRKALFQVADRLGCTKIALGHHKDDIIQTFFLNLIFQGEISAMKPKQELFDGKITLIRPLAYVEEHQTIRFAQERNFPIPHCRCPNAATSKRKAVSEIITQMEKMSPQFKTNIYRSMQRIKTEYLV